MHGHASLDVILLRMICMLKVMCGDTDCSGTPYLLELYCCSHSTRTHAGYAILILQQSRSSVGWTKRAWKAVTWDWPISWHGMVHQRIDPHLGSDTLGGICVVRNRLWAAHVDLSRCDGEMMLRGSTQAVLLPAHYLHRCLGYVRCVSPIRPRIYVKTGACVHR